MTTNIDNILALANAQVRAEPHRPASPPIWPWVRHIIQHENVGQIVALYSECRDSNWNHLSSPPRQLTNSERERIVGLIEQRDLLPYCEHEECTHNATHYAGRLGVLCDEHHDAIATCDVCGHYEVGLVLTDNDECASCYHARLEDEEEEEARSSQGLLAYNVNPLDHLRFLDADGSPVGRSDHIVQRYPVYGLELELEADDRVYAMDRIRDELGDDYCIFKYDGSLAEEEGFELVSAPAPLAVHQQRLANFPHISGLTSYNNENCGIHVHISRAILSPLQIGKMLVFTNSPANREFIEAVAQRNSERWAKISPKKWGEYSNERYEAINTTRSDTIELRIFRGNTRRNRILKCLEFADALVSFCAPSNASCAELRTDRFVAHVAAQSKRWPNLSEFLRERSYLPARKVKKIA